MARYIVEFLFCSGLFVALYKLLIKGRVAHYQARMYLVWAMLLSVVIPLLELPLYPAQTVYYQLPIIDFTEPSISSVEVGDTATALQATARVDWRHILSMVAYGIYILVFALNIARFVYRLWVIRNLRLNAQLTAYEDYTLAESERISCPFSFWRTIFMGIRYAGRDREQIIIHELSHIRHHHTAERLAIELLRCVFWFNPFVWLAGRYLVEVQEWEADNDVLSQGYDVYQYRQLIFRQLFGYDVDITCGLNSQLTKNRFLMMTNFKKGKLSFVRFGAAIPMVGAMILAFGAVRAEAEPAMPSDNTEQTSTTHKIGILADGKITFNGKGDECRGVVDTMKVSEVNPHLEKSAVLQGKSLLKTLPKGENVLRPRVESGDRVVEFRKDGYALDGRSVTFDELKSSFADLSSGMSLRIWGAKNSDRQLDISFLPDGHFSVQVFDNGSGKKNYKIGRVDNTINMNRYKNQFDVRLTKLESAPY